MWHTEGKGLKLKAFAMPPAFDNLHVIGLAHFDGKHAEVFVGELTRAYASIRAIGGTFLPDRFRLVVADQGIDAACIVTGRRGKQYTVIFA